jgi:hypothetical protein
MNAALEQGFHDALGSEPRDQQADGKDVLHPAFRFTAAGLPVRKYGSASHIDV